MSADDERRLELYILQEKLREDYRRRANRLLLAPPGPRNELMKKWEAKLR